MSRFRKAAHDRSLFTEVMSLAATPKRPEHQVGRYAIFDEIAAGGMATVHLARLVGSGGFSRVVAAKRMHRHFLQDPNFRRMFLAEARLAARILHPNVVPILDVLSDHDDELIIVMEYIHGESLLALLRAAKKAKLAIAVPIGCAIAAALLEGLHAAHEAQNEKGEPLGIVHRDVSPQNVLVGADGVARVLDFGIAKAVHEQTHTNPGTLKGKFSYMAPEVVRGAAVTRQADVFSAGVVLWEVLAGKMLFGGASEHERLARIVAGKYPSPRQYNPRVSPALEKVVAKALQLETGSRYATAQEFAVEIESAVPIASRRVVSEWVRKLAASTLDQRETMIHAIETSSVVAKSELPTSTGRAAGTPPPIPFGMTNPYASTRPLPQVPPPLPPSIEELVANSGLSTHEDSASYAAIEIHKTRGSTSANAPPARRRLSARVIAATAVVAVAALTLVFMFSRHSPAKVRSTVSNRAATVAPVPSSTQISRPLPAAPDAGLTVVEVTSASSDIFPPSTSEQPTKDKAVPRRALPSSRPQARAPSHAKHYLPSNL
jgi:serine/threonine protein kinase